jgi:DNA-binding response OmpR family regulator
VVSFPDLKHSPIPGSTDLGAGEIAAAIQRLLIRLASWIKDGLHMRILIAEDDEALARFIRQGLEAESYQVETVSDGEQARQAGTEQDFDVVILDLHLPTIDGVSVLRHLRPKKPSVPVLILTQRTRVEDRVECLDTGADDYLGKPF